MATPFLTARWVNLALITYGFSPDLLADVLPPGCEADVREGQAFASLVAFDFLDTRVMGVKWPGHVNFPEVNLRFYVTQSGRRGVAFVKEFVPKRAIAWMAKAIYNEPYAGIPMSSRTEQSETSIKIEHRLRFGGRENLIEVEASKPATQCGVGSLEHFFKEHEWGYGRTRRGRLLRYNVVHPMWDCYPVTAWRIDYDFEAAYGARWAFLKDAKPFHVALCAGSDVRVYPHGKVLT